jgi:hypothetical protein
VAPFFCLPWGLGPRTLGLGPWTLGPWGLGPWALVACLPACCPALGLPALGLPALGLPALGLPALGLPCLPACSIPAISLQHGRLGSGDSWRAEYRHQHATSSDAAISNSWNQDRAITNKLSRAIDSVAESARLRPAAESHSAVPLPLLLLPQIPGTHRPALFA